MNRRNFFAKTMAIITGNAFFPLANASFFSSSTKTVEIDSWKFSLPFDWKKMESGLSRIPYFEAKNGSKGCYVKSLILAKYPEESSIESATNIHQTLKKSLDRNPEKTWEVMQKNDSDRGDSFLSVANYFDSKNMYHITSAVLVHKDLAIQLTLHDYLCNNYLASEHYFNPIIESLSTR